MWSFYPVTSILDTLALSLGKNDRDENLIPRNRAHRWRTSKSRLKKSRDTITEIAGYVWYSARLAKIHAARKNKVPIRTMVRYCNRPALSGSILKFEPCHDATRPKSSGFIGRKSSSKIKFYISTPFKNYTEIKAYLPSTR